MYSFKTVLRTSLFLLVGLQTNMAQSVDPLNYIPKKSQNVFVLNTPSVVGKMDVAALKELDFVKDFTANPSGKKALSLMGNPAESGINFLKPITIAISDLEDTKFQTINIIIPLANAAKFKSVMSENKSNITQKGNLTVIENDSTNFFWNDKMLVVASLKKKKDPMAAFAQQDTTEEQPAPPKIDPSVYFDNNETNDKADALRELMRTPHDIYLYQTADGTGKSMKGMMASMMFGLKPNDLDGNVTTGWADFEKGRIYGETSQKMNEAMTQKFASLGRPKPSVNWNQYVNTNSKPVMLMSFSLNPMGLKQMLSENEMLKMGAEKAMTKSGGKFSMDNVLAAFGGDVFATFAMDDKDASFLIGLSVSDKKSVEKLMTDEFKFKKMSKNLYYSEPKAEPAKTESSDDDPAPATLPKAKTKTFFLFKDDVVLIGKEKQIMALKEAPKLTNIVETSEWQKSLKNKPVNLLFDFSAIASSLGPLAQGKLDGIPFESMSMTMANKVSTFELKMNDKEHNALTSFFQFVDKTMKEKKEKAKMLENIEEKKD